MLSFTTWQARFPQFATIPEATFNVYLGDAVLEMGSIEARWLDLYDVAQAYLVAHMLSMAEKFSVGDHTPQQPLRQKVVDGVEVEYAVSRDSVDNFDNYLSTSYGQQYTKYRRICFAGPRIA